MRSKIVSRPRGEIFSLCQWRYIFQISQRDLKRLSKEKAENWLKEHALTKQLITTVFGIGMLVCTDQTYFVSQ